MKKYQHLFGPVPSRRFGRSLGVDLSPFKTCSFDCLFCQLGRTTNHTVKRKEYINTKEVLEELGDWIKVSGEADYITLAGSGEPTLHACFGEVVKFAREHSSIPVALLTNASLMVDADVRASAAQADVVKVSLSAGDQDLFEEVNRPAPGITLNNVVEGLQAFRKEFNGQLWLEVFAMRGLNSTPKAMAKIAELAQTFQPDVIHLNTAVRPPAESYVAPVPKDQLEELSKLFEPTAEVVAEFHSDCIPTAEANGDAVFGMLKRRPCTTDQVSTVLGLHINEVSKYIGKLVRTGQVQAKVSGDATYYSGSPTDE